MKKKRDGKKVLEPELIIIVFWFRICCWQGLTCVRVKDESGSSPCVDLASVPYTQQPKHGASAGFGVWGLGVCVVAHDEDLQEAAQRVPLRVRHQYKQPCPQANIP